MSRFRRLGHMGTITLGLALCLDAAAAPSYQVLNYSISGGRAGSVVYKYFDINQDGTEDVGFKHSPYGSLLFPAFAAEEAVQGVSGASVTQIGSKQDYLVQADGIGVGQYIGPHLNWTAPWTFEARINSNLVSDDPDFRNPGTSVGVRLMIAGQPHYAWVGVRYTPGDYDHRQPERFDVYNAAWETTPNTPILTGIPEPVLLGPVVVSLALLARRHRGRRECLTRESRRTRGIARAWREGRSRSPRTA